MNWRGLEGSEKFSGGWVVMVCCDYSVISGPALLNLREIELERSFEIEIESERSRRFRKVSWWVGGGGML